MTSTSILWFRRDLRLADNPALLHAVEAAGRGGAVVPLFVLDPALLARAGAPRLAFLFDCLRTLDADTGGRLVVRTGRPEEVVPALATEVEAATVVAADDAGPYGRGRDERVEAAMGDTPLVRVGSPYAVDPGGVVKGDGGNYRVFTPFYRTWLSHGWPPPAPAPKRVTWAHGVQTDPIPPGPATGARLPEPGEAAAGERLAAFTAHVRGYGERRNLPAEEGTSRLSPYLRFGCIHPRQVLAAIGTGRGAEAFRREIGWREFCADLLFHQPDVARRSANRAMEALPVDEGPEADARFTAWTEGRTGYPIVDAGMRQLLDEAWIHNRVRMIVASFLVKDLHIDWRRGARWFMEHLVDGDLASNSQNWQWVAGTGNDPAPFVRVFNPSLQAKRFDPDGSYVRRYVPELADVDGGAVHDPRPEDRNLFSAPDYPEPLVDHATERADALDRYARAVQGGRKKP